jgi:hypothetical protein
MQSSEARQAALLNQSRSLVVVDQAYPSGRKRCAQSKETKRVNVEKSKSGGKKNLEIDAVIRCQPYSVVCLSGDGITGESSPKSYSNGLVLAELIFPGRFVLRSITQELYKFNTFRNDVRMAIREFVHKVPLKEIEIEDQIHQLALFTFVIHPHFKWSRFDTQVSRVRE